MALGVQPTKSSWRYLREQCHRAPNGGGVPTTSWDPATARSLRILGRGWSAYAQAPELQVFTNSRDLRA